MTDPNSANVPAGFHGPDCEGHAHGCMSCAITTLLVLAHTTNARLSLVVDDNGRAEVASSLGPADTARVLRQLADRAERRASARFMTYVDRGGRMPPV